MASELISCPYCNAYVTLPGGAVEEGQRLLCTRCGETFDFRGFPREAIVEKLPHPLTAYSPQPDAASSAGAPEFVHRSWSNRAIAGFVLGGMAAMAIIGLLLSLATESVRRAHDAGIPKDRTLPLYLAVFVGLWIVGLAFVTVRELRLRYQRTYAAQRLPLGYVLATVTFLAVGGLAVTVLAVQISKRRASRPALEDTKPEARPVAPASLPTLGYLPPDVDFIAGIHFAEMQADLVAREFLSQLRFGPADLNLSVIQKWTGLHVEDLDHAVLGLRVQGQLIPRLDLVIRTTRPYDVESIRKSINLSRSPEPGKKELYRVKLDKSLLTPILWFADEHTIVVGLKPEDLAYVPAKPRENVDHLQVDVAFFLKQRLGQGTPAWVVGHAENWDLFWRILLDRQAREGQPVELLSSVRTFGVWFQFNDGMALNTAFQCVDGASAKALEAYLTGHDRELVSLSGATVAGLTCSMSGQGLFVVASALPRWSTSLGVPKPFSMAAPRAEFTPLFRELGQSLKSDRNDRWVVLQAKASTATIQKALAPS